MTTTSITSAIKKSNPFHYHSYMHDVLMLDKIQDDHFKRATNENLSTIHFTVKLKGGLRVIFTVFFTFGKSK